MKWEDPIVKEVREARDKIANQYEYDVVAIGRYYQEKQRKEGRKTVVLQPKRPDDVKRAAR